MKLRVLFSLYVFLIGTFLTIVLVNSVSFNALSKKLKAEKAVFSLIPQGWAFFTRNPREGQTILYHINSENKIEKTNYRHADKKFLFGLSRTCTRIYTELGILKESIPDSLYTPIQWNYQCETKNTIDLSKIQSIRLKAPLKENTLKGKYLFVIQQPIPWAWSSDREKIQMPAVCVILNVI